MSFLAAAFSLSQALSFQHIQFQVREAHLTDLHCQGGYHDRQVVNN